MIAFFPLQYFLFNLFYGFQVFKAFKIYAVINTNGFFGDVLYAFTPAYELATVTAEIALNNFIFEIFPVIGI